MRDLLSAIWMIQERMHIAWSVQGKYGKSVSTAQYLSSSEPHCWDGSKTSLQK